MRVNVRLPVLEVGMDDDRLHVGDDEERWIEERISVELELLVRCIEVLVLALVLPGEEPLPPHVSPPVATGALVDPFLERERGTLGIGFCRRRVIEHVAEIVEVGLSCRTFLELGSPPLVNEFLRRHCLGVHACASLYWLEQ